MEVLVNGTIFINLCPIKPYGDLYRHIIAEDLSNKTIMGGEHLVILEKLIYIFFPKMFTRLKEYKTGQKVER